MRLDFSFQTVSNQRSYAAASVAPDQTRWHFDTFRCYRTADGISSEQFMTPMNYEDLRNMYMMGAMNAASGRPLMFADRPRDKALFLGPLPNDVYTIYGEYQQASQRMTANTDAPANGLFPVQWHMAIVHLAVTKYAAYEGAGSLYDAHLAEYKKILRGIEKDQLDDVDLGEPLV
jgi:hypothetical protein